MQRLALALALMVSMGCGGSSKKATHARAGNSSSDRQQQAVQENKGDMTVSTDTGDDLSWLAPVYFEFDSADLLPATRDTLARLHEWLAVHPKVQLMTIEGHCDEQGTTEYNIALGQRRAQALVEYLARLGTDARRLKPVSFGALRPAVDGHDEVAWAKNRRGEFRVEPPAH